MAAAKLNCCAMTAARSALARILAEDRKPYGLRELVRIARLDHPAKVMLADSQCRFGIGLRHQDDRPADRQQIVEPAGHRHAGEISAIGNEPDIRRGKKRLETFLRHALDQRHIGQTGVRLQLLEPIEADPPPRQQEMDFRIVLQQLRCAKHDIGIVGKTQIAGKADLEAGGMQAAVRIVGFDRPYARLQHGPIRNEADLVARCSPVAQQQRLGIAPDDDDGIERAKHQRVGATHRPGEDRRRPQQARHDQDVGEEVVHDQHRPGALQPRCGGHRVRQHEGGGNGEHDVVASQPREQRRKHPQREKAFCQRTPDQRGFFRNPVSDFDDGRPARLYRLIGRGAGRSRQHQHRRFRSQMIGDRGHDTSGGAGIRRVVLADDGDFCLLCIQCFRHISSRRITQPSNRIREPHP